MVYRGKPSAACEPCRKRKIKCDQGRPSCSRCLKNGKDCTGYRDVQALSFINESTSVIERSKQSQTASRHASQPIQWVHVKQEQPRSRDRDHVRRKRTVARATEESPILLDSMALSYSTIKEDPKEIAMSFFQQEYLRPGYFDFVPDFFEKWDTKSLLENAVQAAGMLGLANIVKSQEAYDLARRQYGKALQLTNTALRDPIEVHSQQTLATVMLLGMYETMTSDHLGAWQKHVEGASELLRYQKAEDLRSRPARMLFQQLRTSIFIRSCFNSTPVPQHIIDLTKLFPPILETYEDPKTKELEELVDEWFKFKSLMRMNVSTDKQAIMAACHAVERRLRATSLSNSVTTPEYATFQTSDEHLHSWRRCYDVFSDGPWRIRQQIDILMLLLLVNALQLRMMVGKPSIFSSEERRHVASTLYGTMDEICADIPHCLDFLTTDSATGESRPAILGYGVMHRTFFAGRILCDAVLNQIASDSWEIPTYGRSLKLQMYQGHKSKTTGSSVDWTVLHVLWTSPGSKPPQRPGADSGPIVVYGTSG